MQAYGKHRLVDSPSLLESNGLQPLNKSRLPLPNQSKPDEFSLPVYFAFDEIKNELLFSFSHSYKDYTCNRTTNAGEDHL